VTTDAHRRCFGGDPGHGLYAAYHDEEWGVPQHDDRRLFEMLVLEGAQAGLNWETVLRKRTGYRRAFHDFDVARVAAMTDAELEGLLTDPGVIRNRLKLWSARRNAAAFLDIQAASGSFHAYAWDFVDGRPVVNRWQSREQVPVQTPASRAMARDLQRRGMNFVGPTIVYAFMQATGMVDDHLAWCWRRTG
jgi:DNA-3-methyladenine glycosylase I